jgi:hypothetical protein
MYTDLFQKSAFYTCKDLDLPAKWRLDRALEILGGRIGLLAAAGAARREEARLI